MQPFAGILDRAAADQCAKFEDDRVRNRVVNTVALSPAADEACVKERLQVLGHVGLVAAKGLDDVADRALPRLKDLENAQALRLAQHPEPARDQIDHLVG